MYKTISPCGIFSGAAAYNTTCIGPGTGDCAIANNICDAKTLKCACNTNLYRKNGTVCVTSKTCLITNVATLTRARVTGRLHFTFKLKKVQYQHIIVSHTNNRR